MGPRSGLVTAGCPARLRRTEITVAVIGADIRRIFAPEGLEPAQSVSFKPRSRSKAMTPALGGTCRLSMTVVDVSGSVEALADGTGGSVDAVTKGGGRSNIPAEEENGYV
jgi:hypothetical protein